LSQFSGQESVIDISEIPGGGLQGSLITPADNWSRSVNGVQFIGGKELTLWGRTSVGDGSNPFRSPPLTGDPNGFSGASFGSSLGMSIPSGFALGFTGLAEAPHRIGLGLASLGANPPRTLRTTLVFSDTTIATYFYDAPILRLLAYESSKPINRIDFSWTTSFPGDGPGIEIDDIRFEAVPEPSSWALGLMGIACGGWAVRKRKRSPVNRSLVTAASCLTLALAGVVPARAVTIDWVTVGDPGNAADDTGYGAVDSEYRIGKYEITIGQYTEFLNAVAASDPYLLYFTSLEFDTTIAGILRSGVSGSYAYSVISPSGLVPPGASSPSNRPVTNTSWFGAARFANWMHNGQGAGGTETGAYTLNGTIRGAAPARNPGALFYIPTEDQWYKAAYYKGGSTNAGYWDYATQSDAPPGNSIGSGANQANYYAGDFAVTQSVDSSGDQNYLTDVGAFTNSVSAYGTFDQTGNVIEWNDLLGTSDVSRGLRGGYWGRDDGLSSSYRNPADPSNNQYNQVGFRLAAPVAVPEPSTWLMGLAGLAYAFTLRRSRRAA
jgi:MYXO-CTERM domain-containing protein